MWLQLATGTSNRRANFVATVSYQESKFISTFSWNWLTTLTNIHKHSSLRFNWNVGSRGNEPDTIVSQLPDSSQSQSALSLVNRRQLDSRPNPLPAAIDRLHRLRPAVHQRPAGNSRRHQCILMLFLTILLYPIWWDIWFQTGQSQEASGNLVLNGDGANVVRLDQHRVVIQVSQHHFHIFSEKYISVSSIAVFFRGKWASVWPFAVHVCRTTSSHQVGLWPWLWSPARLSVRRLVSNCSTR